MKYYHIKRAAIALIVLILFALPALAQNDESFTEQEKIKIYRQILKQEKDPKALAETHFKIAELLEAGGRNTEATSEYLKVILNYPEAADIANKAEEKLSALYAKFQETETGILEGGQRGEETKDPAIFFTYIKTLYETYREQGNYEKALYLLKKLIKMDPANQQYYLDAGSIYLEGYNDSDSALEYFNRLAAINPLHPSVYTEMGLACEKKGDYTNAIKYYRKSVEISPLNVRSMYGLSRMEALKLASDKKMIKDWYFLGPFDNADKKALEKKIGPEETIDIKKTYKGIDGKTITWKRPYSYEASGYVDLNAIFEPNDNVLAFALTYAYSPSEKEAQLRIGSDDPVRVWIGDKLIFFKDITRPAEFDRDIIKITFKKGWNRILIKAAENWGDWGFYFRVTDMNGNTPGNIIFDPLRDDARVKTLYSKLTKEKGLKIARMSFMYGFTFFVLLSGLYLLVSNIINKIKIREMKEDFIASVSHELKTPLAAIKMFTETLGMDRVKSESQKKEYYATIVRETDRLTRFIDKILDFQKIERGKKIYSFDKINMRRLLEEAVNIYKNQAQDEALIVEENYAGGLPPVEADEDAMLQVILNLLTNAYKYSKNDKYIKVEAAHENGQVVISVSDHGMGISKDKLSKIFDKFYRVEAAATKEIKGSGIGLAFVKSVVEAHDGRITVESEVNGGSKFTIFMPVSR